MFDNISTKFSSIMKNLSGKGKITEKNIRDAVEEIRMSLLGVTQMEAGVSTTVSYRLARIAGEPVILNEDDADVDFDSEGRRR